MPVPFLFVGVRQGYSDYQDAALYATQSTWEELTW